LKLQETKNDKKKTKKECLKLGMSNLGFDAVEENLERYHKFFEHSLRMAQPSGGIIKGKYSIG
jgi:hypothetical protein